jgi:hypothetical protein
VYPVLSDLNMLLLTGGCERTEEEYRGLYRAAGFELTRTVATKSPTGTTVIELVHRLAYNGDAPVRKK